jgi:hypothetical protein
MFNKILKQIDSGGLGCEQEPVVEGQSNKKRHRKPVWNFNGFDVPSQGKIPDQTRARLAKLDRCLRQEPYSLIMIGSFGFIDDLYRAISLYVTVDLKASHLEKLVLPLSLYKITV